MRSRGSSKATRPSQRAASTRARPRCSSTKYPQARRSAVNRMRAHVRLAARAVVMMGLAMVAVEAAEAQEVLFNYVAPIASLTGVFKAAPAANDTGAAIAEVGYGSVNITSRNVERFKKGAPDNLVKTYEAMQKGTPLRKRVDDVLNIGKVTNVTYELIDD